MRVMILAHALRAGGGRVTCTNVLRALCKLDSENEYYIVVPDQQEYRSLGLEGGQRKIHYYHRRFGAIGRRFFDTFTLKHIAAGFQPDLIWSMGGIGFSNPPCPQAISIQNAYVMYDKDRWERLSLRNHLRLFCVRRAFRKQLKNTQLVFCQTSVMEQRLRQYYNYRGKSRVTGKAQSWVFDNDTAGKAPAVFDRYQGKYKLIYITGYYPHKGLEILVDVMARYRDELADTVVFLTIAPERSEAVRLLKSIREKNLEDRIINLGRLPHEKIAAYYRNCDALIMPTRLESFSSSYLEAMYFGVPILTSDLDFAHEVCGDAALYFNPWKAASIKEAIRKLKNDPQLAANLIANGKKQLQTSHRSWEEITKQLLMDLRDIAGKK